MKFSLAFLAALVLGRFPASAAVLSATGQNAAPGQAVITSLAFSGEGQTVSGVQFDLEWDEGLDAKIVVGDGLRGTSILYTAPLGSRSIRCLFIGGGGLPDGELLKVFLVVSPTVAPGALRVQIRNTVATDPDGNSVTLQPATVTLTVGETGALFVAVPDEGILNAASLLPGPVSPGELVTLIGGLPAGEGTALVNGIPAPILYGGVNQWNIAIPFGIDPAQPATLEVQIAGRTASVPLPVAPLAPAIFTQGGSGIGPGAILNQDYSVNSASNPAARGSTVLVFGTGFGAIDPPPTDGQPVSSSTPIRASVTATLGGFPAVVDYAGAAPGLVAGVTQINVRIPFEAPTANSVALTLQADGIATQAAVTVAIR